MKLYSFCILLLLSLSSGHAQTTHDSALRPSFDPYAETSRYINQVPVAARAKSDAYFEGGYWLLLWDMIYGIAIAMVFVYMGLSDKTEKFVSGIKNKNLQNLSFAFIYFLLAWLLVFPLHMYETWIREHHYGLSNLGFSVWLKDELITLAINSTALSLVVMVMYLFIRKTARSWWVWTALLSISFMILVIFISLVFLDPVFNDYKPLPESPLKKRYCPWPEQTKFRPTMYTCLMHPNRVTGSAPM